MRAGDFNHTQQKSINQKSHSNMTWGQRYRVWELFLGQLCLGHLPSCHLSCSTTGIPGRPPIVGHYGRFIPTTPLVWLPLGGQGELVSGLFTVGDSWLFNWNGGAAGHLGYWGWGARQLVWWERGLRWGRLGWDCWELLHSQRRDKSHLSHWLLQAPLCLGCLVSRPGGVLFQVTQPIHSFVGC